MLLTFEWLLPQYQNMGEVLAIYLMIFNGGIDFAGVCTVRKYYVH